MSFATGLEGAVLLLPWFRRDKEFRSVSPTYEIRWFEWGYFMRGGEPEGWYILVRLPSYLMKPTDYDMGPPCWHQRCLLFKGQLPAGKEGWSMIELEC